MQSTIMELFGDIVLLEFLQMCIYGGALDPSSQMCYDGVPRKQGGDNRRGEEEDMRRK
jgi:hypothetical protein